MLNLEAVGCVKFLFAYADIRRNRVNRFVVLAVFHAIHVAFHDLFDIGRVLIDQISQIHKGFRIHQLANLPFGENNIRVLAACGHHGNPILSAPAADIKFRL
ncbi:hypothetical protein D3C76_1384180 [compost metagenome]